MAGDGLFDVRKVIEKSTSKVSLRELEKRGFRKVKVLKSNDINKLIRQAVETVLLSREKLSDAEKETYIKKSREEFDRMMKQNKRQLELQSHYEQKFNGFEKTLADKERIHRDVSQRYEQRIEELVERLHKKGTQEVDQHELKSLKRKLAEQEAEGAKLGKLREELDETQTRLRQVGNDKRSVENELSATRNHVNSLQEKISAAHDNTSLKVNELMTQTQMMREKVLSLESEKRVLSKVEIPRLEDRIEELMQSQRELRQQKRDLQNKVDELEAKLRALGDQDPAELKHQLSRSQLKIEALEHQLEKRAEESPELRQMTRELQAIRAKEKRTEQRFEELFTRLSSEIQSRAAAPQENSSAGLHEAINAMSDKITRTLASRMVDDSGNVVSAERMAEVSLAALFDGEDQGVSETNIRDLKVNTRKAVGVKGTLAKLRNLRKGDTQ